MDVAHGLERGDLVPHFTVTDAAGRRIAYAASIWQRRPLVLVTTGAQTDAATALLRRFESRHLGVDDGEVACVVTSDPIPGLPPCGLLVADRWGEIAVVQQTASAADLPDADEVRAWVAYVQQQCPECQGETR
jgi:hypothetical protein